MPVSARNSQAETRGVSRDAPLVFRAVNCQPGVCHSIETGDEVIDAVRLRLSVDGYIDCDLGGGWIMIDDVGGLFV